MTLTPDYLLGALADDEIDVGTAIRLADGYADACQNFGSHDLAQWRIQVAKGLGLGKSPNASMALFSQPSPHLVDQYDRLAAEYRRIHEEKH